MAEPIADLHPGDFELIRRHVMPRVKENLAVNANLTNANWDGSGSAEAIALIGSIVTKPGQVIIRSDVDFFVAFDTSSDTWTGAVGVALVADLDHILPCYGAEYMHFKGVSATGSIWTTVEGD